ncbi:MAG: hypothetical protein DI630_00220 [Gordonia sp. (in: high G+C Gram-positive bacteria)]|nr:MAG: hypothetical protein DI630_00220 [Gordonia sp. (in: high G+C Gram-positive bacteria)]
MLAVTTSVDEDPRQCTLPMRFDLAKIGYTGDPSQVELGLWEDPISLAETLLHEEGLRERACFGQTGSGQTMSFLMALFSRRGRLDVDRLELALLDPASVLARERAGLCGEELQRYFSLGDLISPSVRGLWTQYLVVLLRQLLDIARDLIRSRATKLFCVGESPGHLVATHPHLTRGPTTSWLIKVDNQSAGSAARL